MSNRLIIYRTDGKSFQPFENYYCPQEIVEELVRQGMEPMEEPIEEFHHQIKELQPFVEIVKNDLNRRHLEFEEDKMYLGEEIGLAFPNRGRSIFDFTSYFVTNKNDLDTFAMNMLYGRLKMLIENTSAFVLYNLIEFLKNDIDWSKSKVSKDEFKLKETSQIIFHYS